MACLYEPSVGKLENVPEEIVNNNQTTASNIIENSKRTSGVIFVKNSISIFLKAYNDIIDKISIFSKSSQSPRCIQVQVYV